MEDHVQLGVLHQTKIWNQQNVRQRCLYKHHGLQLHSIDKLHWRARKVQNQVRIETYSQIQKHDMANADTKTFSNSIAFTIEFFEKDETLDQTIFENEERVSHSIPFTQMHNKGRCTSEGSRCFIQSFCMGRLRSTTTSDTSVPMSEHIEKTPRPGTHWRTHMWYIRPTTTTFKFTDLATYQQLLHGIPDQGTIFDRSHSSFPKMATETWFSVPWHRRVFWFSTRTMDGTFTNNGYYTKIDYGPYPYFETIPGRWSGHTSCRSPKSERTHFLPSIIFSGMHQHMARSTIVHTIAVHIPRSIETSSFFGYKKTAESIQMGNQLGSTPSPRIHFLERQKNSTRKVELSSATKGRPTQNCWNMQLRHWKQCWNKYGLKA